MFESGERSVKRYAWWITIGAIMNDGAWRLMACAGLLATSAAGAGPVRPTLASTGPVDQDES